MMIIRRELWKEVRGFPKYSVSSFGRIYSRHTQRFLKLSVDRDGYVCVSLYSAKGKQQVKVHRVVATHYLPLSDLSEVNHKDLVKANNRVTNLEWCSSLENKKHAVRAGVLCAVNSPKRGKVLNLNAVLNMRVRCTKGETFTALAKEYGCHLSTVQRAVDGVTWS